MRYERGRGNSLYLSIPIYTYLGSKCTGTSGGAGHSCCPAPLPASRWQPQPLSTHAPWRRHSSAGDSQACTCQSQKLTLWVGHTSCETEGFVFSVLSLHVIDSSTQHNSDTSDQSSAIQSREFQREIQRCSVGVVIIPALEGDTHQGIFRSKARSG